MRSSNPDLSRRTTIRLLSAAGLTALLPGPSVAFSGTDKIGKAGANLTGRLLPETLAEELSGSQEAAIQENMMTALASLPAGGDEAVQHVLEQWAFFYTGDKYHILKCPTCHHIASQALAGVAVRGRHLVSYIPELQVPQCFTMYVEAEKHAVRRGDKCTLHLSEGEIAASQAPIAALIFYHGRYWAAGSKSAYLGESLPSLAPLKEVDCAQAS